MSGASARCLSSIVCIYESNNTGGAGSPSATVVGVDWAQPELGKELDSLRQTVQSYVSDDIPRDWGEDVLKEVLTRLIRVSLVVTVTGEIGKAPLTPLIQELLAKYIFVDCRVEVERLPGRDPVLVGTITPPRSACENPLRWARIQETVLDYTGSGKSYPLSVPRRDTPLTVTVRASTCAITHGPVSCDILLPMLETRMSEYMKVASSVRTLPPVVPSRIDSGWLSARLRGTPDDAQLTLAMRLEDAARSPLADPTQPSPSSEQQYITLRLCELLKALDEQPSSMLDPNDIIVQPDGTLDFASGRKIRSSPTPVDGDTPSAGGPLLPPVVREAVSTADIAVDPLEAKGDEPRLPADSDMKDPVVHEPVAAAGVSSDVGEGKSVEHP